MRRVELNSATWKYVGMEVWLQVFVTSARDGVGELQALAALKP